MPPDVRDAAYLWDMRQYAARVQELASLSFEQFQSEPATRLATERAVEIIGEAARHVSADFQAEHPEIAWREIIGLRNILAHQYAEVNINILWGVVTEDVPVLIAVLDGLLPPPPD